MALSGDGSILAVGAIGESSAATGVGTDWFDNSRSSAGAVYIFVRNGENEWSQQTYVKAPNTDAGDYFGYAVALSDDGDTLAVGAYLESGASMGVGGDAEDNNASKAGAVYLY